ncbi:hypothetical protein CEXT_481401, partial [Caerostris extrusa]
MQHSPRSTLWSLTYCTSDGIRIRAAVTKSNYFLTPRVVRRTNGV